jgi:hypothetical protein
MTYWTWQEWLVAGLTLTLVLCVLFYKFRQEILLKWKGATVEGSIVNWMASNEAGKRYYYPLIYFRTETGKEYKFRAEERCEGAPMYEVGTKVQVKYLPKNPDVREVVYPKAIND